MSSSSGEGEGRGEIAADLVELLARLGEIDGEEDTTEAEAAGYRQVVAVGDRWGLFRPWDEPGGRPSGRDLYGALGGPAGVGGVGGSGPGTASAFGPTTHGGGVPDLAGLRDVGGSHAPPARLVPDVQPAGRAGARIDGGDGSGSGGPGFVA